MTKYIFKTWLILTVLALSALLIGACQSGSGDPIVPNNTGVQDFTEGGGGIDDVDLSELVTTYDLLTDVGGGVDSTPTALDFAIFGAYDRWTGQPLTASFYVTKSDKEVVEFKTDNRGIIELTAPDYPITVSAYVSGYVYQTVFKSSANVYALSMELSAQNRYVSEVIAFVNYTDQLLESSGANYLLKGKTTQDGASWVERTFNSPYFMMQANPFKPLGSVLFNYTDDGAGYYPQGYSYQNFGQDIFGGGVYSWQVEFTSSDPTPTYYNDDTAYYTTVETDAGKCIIEPGGLVYERFEFIPYGVYDNSTFEGAGDTKYNVWAYDAPVTADREILRAETHYTHGSREVLFVDWDPTGTDLPAFSFTDPPTMSNSEIIGGEFGVSAGVEFVRFDFDWNTIATPGLQKFTVYASNGDAIWQCYTAEDLTTMEVIYRGTAFTKNYPSQVEITRISNTTETIDDFNHQTLFGTTTSWATSSRFPVQQSVL
jgi:hypothetical protein